MKPLPSTLRNRLYDIDVPRVEAFYQTVEPEHRKAFMKLVLYLTRPIEQRYALSVSDGPIVREEK